MIRVAKQAAQRRGGCPLPGDTQGQAGWGSEHPDQVMSLFIAGNLDQIAFRGSFQFKLFSPSSTDNAGEEHEGLDHMILNLRTNTSSPFYW